MNAAEIENLFDYNAWANGKILDALSGIPEADYLEDMKSSHGGLHGTMVHIVFAQHVWLLHWTGKPVDAAFAAAREAVSLGDVQRFWREIEDATRSFLNERLRDSLVGQSFELKTSKGESYSHTYGESMQHLINHSTYHRGQMAGLMRQRGVRPPSTDYIRFARDRK